MKHGSDESTERGALVDSVTLLAELYELPAQARARLLGTHAVLVRRAGPGLLSAKVEHSCGLGSLELPPRFWLIRNERDVLDVRHVRTYKLGQAPPGTAPDTSLLAWQFEQIATWQWHASDKAWAIRFGIQVVETSSRTGEQR